MSGAMGQMRTAPPFHAYQNWSVRAFEVALYSIGGRDLVLAYDSEARIFCLLVGGLPATYTNAGSRGPDEGSVVIFSVQELKCGAWSKGSSLSVRLCGDKFFYDLRFSTLIEADSFVDWLLYKIKMPQEFFMDSVKQREVFLYVPPLPDQKIGSPSKEPKHTVQSGLQNLYTSGIHSDVIIGSATQKFHAHKAIICTRSAWFAHALQPNFVEGSTNCINLPENSKTVSHILRHLYEMDISLFESVFVSYALKLEEEKVDVLNELVFLYVAADKYQLTNLAAQAAKTLDLRLPWTNSLHTITSLAKLIYGNTGDTDRVIRPVITDYIRKNLNAIIADDRAKEEIMDNPELTMDLLMKLSQKAAEYSVMDMPMRVARMPCACEERKRKVPRAK